jgi:hypothetical protein
MAVKNKNKGKSEEPMKIKTLSDVVCKAAAELLLQADDNIQQALVDSEDKKLTVNLQVKIDESESEPLVKVSIRFSESYTDSRSTRIDDPKQIKLFSADEMKAADKYKEGAESEAESTAEAKE